MEGLAAQTPGTPSSPFGEVATEFAQTVVTVRRSVVIASAAWAGAANRFDALVSVSRNEGAVAAETIKRIKQELRAAAKDGKAFAATAEGSVN